MNIHRHCWKEGLKIRSLTKVLKMVRPKRAKILLFKVATLYRRLYGGGWEVGVGAQTCPHLKNNYKILRLCRAISSLVFKKLLSNLATLLIQGRSLQSCWQIFANWSQLKKPWKGQFDVFFMDRWEDPGFFLREGAPLKEWCNWLVT